MNTVGVADLPDMSIDYETAGPDLKKVGSRVYSQDPRTVAHCFSWKPFEQKSNLWVPGMPLPEQMLWHHRNGGRFRAWNAAFEIDISQNVMTRLHGLPFIDGACFIDTQAEALAMSLPAALGDCAKALNMPIQKDEVGHKVMLKLSKLRDDGKPIDYFDATQDYETLYSYNLTDTDTEAAMVPRLRRLSDFELQLYHITRRMNERGVAVDIELVNAAQEMVVKALALLNAELRDITGYVHHSKGVSTFGASVQLKDWLVKETGWIWINSTGKAMLQKILCQPNVPVNVRAVCELKLRGKVLEKEALDLEMQRLTGYVDRVDGVGAATEVEAMKAWIKERLGPEYMAAHDIELEKLAKEDVADLLILTDLPNSVRRALEIRQEAGKASTGKLRAIQERLCPDGRIRRMWRYYGAATGRWSGAGSRVQLQNLKRPNPDLDIDEAIKDIKAGVIEIVRQKHGSPMDVVADVMRGVIVASEGRDIIDADESQIEARVVATISNETKAIEAFKAYDRKEGPDIYSVTAAGIYGLPMYMVSKDLHRPTGKIAVLGLGFGGGAGALLKMARANRVDLEKIFGPLVEASPEEHVMTMFEAWEERGKRSGVKKEDWQCAELIKVNWRADNPNIVEYWGELERAAIAATRNKGRVFKVGKHVAYQHVGGFLRVRVPKGGFIYYPGAFLKKEIVNAGTEDEYEKEVLYAYSMGLNNKWEEYRLTKLILVENVVQRIARDVIGDAMIKIDALPDYDLILTVHDEVGVEVDKDKGSKDEICSILAAPVEWLPELPVAAAGWRDSRFRKG